MNIAGITMVRDEEFFLSIWLSYYEKQIDRRNLYIIIHGGNDLLAKMCDGANVIRIPYGDYSHTPGNFDFNRHRADLVAHLGAGLLRYYEAFFYTDVDEIICIDPRVGIGLADYVSRFSPPFVLSPLGLDVVQKRKDEASTLLLGQPILGQRRYCRVIGQYTKPVITTVPIQWSPGFHNSTYPQLVTPDDLYMFHLKWCDYSQMVLTQINRDRYRKKLEKVSELAAASEYTNKAEIEVLWNRYDEMELMDGAFEFSEIRAKFHKSWRSRRCLFNPNYYKSLVGSFEFLQHYRFDAYNEDQLRRIPARFAEVV